MLINTTKKQRISWYIYDWANSSYSVIVITLFFGPFLTILAKKNSDIDELLEILNFKIYYASLFAYLTSLTVILQILFLPIIGAVADYSNKKKLLFNLFAIIGSMSTILMFFIGSNYILACILFIISGISFSSGNVIYNSYLNEIAEINERENVSSIGWGLGYLGGGLALLIVLIFFQYHEVLGFSTDIAIRLSLAFAGIWWAFFSIFPIKNLPKPTIKSEFNDKIISFYLSKIFLTFKSLKYLPQTSFFLLAFLLYNDGVQSVISLSGQFGSDELKLEMSVLTKIILIVQIVAFLGSIIFNFISKKIGAKYTVLLNLIIWIVALIYAFIFVNSENTFTILAIIIALVMGGTQALSRAIFSKIIPKGKESEYYSIYEISEKGTSWLGPLVFGLALDITHSYKIGILSLILFFILGFVLLFKFNMKKAMIDVEEYKKQFSQE